VRRQPARSSYVVVGFAAELAAQHNARLILQHVIRPQERAEVLAGHSIDQIESRAARAGSGRTA
jgi:hypothetical protein